MSSKINWLIENTYPGSIVLQTWLSENDVSHSLTQRYVTSGWLKKLRAGVYFRPLSDPNTTPSWSSALQALEQQLNLPVHLAGLSSLKYQGLSHYFQLVESQVWLGVANKRLLPKWFAEFSAQEWLCCNNSKLAEFSPRDFIKLTVDGQELKASSPELAAYEVVDSIGKHLSFQHAAELFQGLTNLSPRKVQSLLERSRAIQTNRVFLYLSHYYVHQWAKRLDETKIKLGTGKRQVVKHGKLAENYLITVPEMLFHRGENG
ncbi:type IV toxin-antitoxin system AbiEi family antitoxin [Shewanella sp. 202IG2-18]|uniref:type IV toxin-antitoxin system AbiEi family antitoxin n=1 Tax=Parashewanella hymeniacidonis TaxID=2807618 RepID=UPI00196225B6|nr:type IV toxin-antitoxin system AbiEi family antitoxin [Parashewanella hymeniacidonis]MBM7073012.1 type IV toxin-antitoxin system AbiEi family antitoxin [Parashewanella hymeniacidonis]